jgi:phosphatidylinositol 3-kinase
LSLNFVYFHFIFSPLHRFRYSLTDNKKALIKFLYALNWDEENEVNELPILLALWRDRSPIDVADALKLLSKDKSFEHPMVREYAVETLRTASDEELLTFLLQLVQALRYEPTNAPAAAATVTSSVPAPPAVVVTPTKGGGQLPEATPVLIPPLPPTLQASTSITSTATATTTTTATAMESSSPLGNFLVDRACKSSVIANYLYWYLKVEREDEEDNSYDLYSSVFSYFENQLLTYSNETRDWYKKLMFVDNYFTTILKLQNEAIKEGKRREMKEQFLIKKLTDGNLSKVPIGWIPLPLDPSIKLSGLEPSSCSMFASAVYPCVIEFNEYFDEDKHKELLKQQQLLLEQEQLAVSSDPNVKVIPVPPVPPVVKKTHKVMFKSGDDLRQDQLIMQMISLMDALLKKVNLDLKLLTYGILAVSKKDGVMEFVRNSTAISSVHKNFGSIQDYLRKYNEDKNGPFQISPL